VGPGRLLPGDAPRIGGRQAESRSAARGGRGMKREAPELDTLVEAARRFAAVQDSFAPEAALAAVMGPRVAQEPIVAARVLSALRQDCTVETGKTERWLMRP